MIERIPTDGESIKEKYLRLDAETKGKVKRRAFEIGYDENSCEFYGIDFYNFQGHQLYAAAMFELNVLP